MAIKSLNPYLMFDGEAEKAIDFYRTALGAKVDESMGIMKFGDVPGAEGRPEDKKRVMHATLQVGDNVVFMLSDSMPNTPVPKAGNVQVALAFDDVADMTKKFDALAAGGKVTMPVHDAFWGDKFGMLTDAFGIDWMFTCPQKKG